MVHVKLLCNIGPSQKLIVKVMCKCLPSFYTYVTAMGYIIMMRCYIVKDRHDTNAILDLKSFSKG